MQFAQTVTPLFLKTSMAFTLFSSLRYRSSWVFSIAVLTKQREKQLVARLNLSEDEMELLNWQLHQIQAGDTVMVTYFQLGKIIGDLEIGAYVTETAQVEEVDMDGGALVLARAYVPFSDLYVIESEIFDQVYEDESYAGREQT